jgi:hypothetical protein
MNMISPGEKLKRILLEIHREPSQNGFIKSLDFYLAADGGLEDLIYHSCINYLLRRLINTARYLQSLHGNERLRTEIRRHLNENTHYTDRQKSNLTKAIEKCIQYTDDNSTSDREKKIQRNEAKKQELNCYICGKTLAFTHQELAPHDHATADHVWPISMGGLNERENIRIACSDCNNKYKKNKIDHRDYHFESISLSQSEKDSGFDAELESIYRIAVYAKCNYICSGCREPASKVGRLFIVQKDIADSWHFLNLDAYCAKCRDKLSKRRDLW